MLRTFGVLLLSLFGATLLSCSGQSVGYQGPLPTTEARRSLNRLWGKQLPAGSVAFTKSDVVLVAFVVGPNAPTVIVEEVGEHDDAGKSRHWIPVLTDGDIGDLFERATGKKMRRSLARQDDAEVVVDELSAAYRAKMTGK